MQSKAPRYNHIEPIQMQNLYLQNSPCVGNSEPVCNPVTIHCKLVSIDVSEQNIRSYEEKVFLVVQVVRVE